jgi:hypothetical protein
MCELERRQQMISWLERLSDRFPSANLSTPDDHHDGVVVERRFTLGLPALLAASFLLGMAREGSAAALTFEEATKQIGDLAKPLIQDPNRNEEEYLHRIASIAMTMREFPPAEFGEPFRKVIRSAMSYRGSGIAVIQWSMEPNTIYQAHNHPGYSGLTIGIRGDGRIHNFDYVGKAPEYGAKGSFQVRETQDMVLREGNVTSIMSTTRDNIHELHAGPKGIHAADIITRIGPDQMFSFLDIGAKPIDAQQRVYEASWGSM